MGAPARSDGLTLDRPRTVSVRRIPLRVLDADRVANADVEDLPKRPATRGECIGDGPNTARPCPFVSCKWHLAIEVTDAGNIREHFPGIEIAELVETCALDIADRGPVTLLEIGEATNVTRERIRQIEADGLRPIRRKVGARGLSEAFAALAADEPDRKESR